MGSSLLPGRADPVATPASRRRDDAVGYGLRAATAAALTVDAVVHLRDAGFYDSVATAVLSQGALFRAEAAAALLVALLLLVWPARIVWLAAVAVAGSAAVAVLTYTYVDPGVLGPLPDMFEPTWALPGKVASAYAEVAGTVLATAGLVRAWRRRPHPAPGGPDGGRPIVGVPGGTR